MTTLMRAVLLGIVALIVLSVCSKASADIVAVQNEMGDTSYYNVQPMGNNNVYIENLSRGNNDYEYKF